MKHLLPDHYSNDHHSSVPITNSIVFSHVLANNPDLTARLLSTLTSLSISSLSYMEPEKSSSSSPDAKAVRFDILAKDDLNRLYDVEMQVYVERKLGRRIRYYQSRMDSHSLTKGKSYALLPDRYILFLCLYDPFNDGKPISEFVTQKKGETDTLDDGSHIIIVNCLADLDRYGDNEDLNCIIRYFKDGTVSDSLTMELDKAVKEFNGNGKERMTAMTYEEELIHYGRNVREDTIAEMKDQVRKEIGDRVLNEGIDIGKQQGIEQGIDLGIESVALKLRNSGFSNDRVSELTGLSVERIDEL